MAKITNVRLPNSAAPEYSREQFDQLIRSLEQIVLAFNTNYTPIVSQDAAAAYTWLMG